MKRLHFLIFLLICPLLGYSQQGSFAYTRLADSLFQHHHYADAARYYERAMKNSVDTTGLMLRIARSYERMNDVKQAEVWYSRAKAGGAAFTFIDLYEYAQVLLMQDKVAEAANILNEIPGADSDESFTHNLLLDIKNSHKFYADSLDFTVKPITANTPASEFAPAYYKDGLVFTSSREVAGSRRKYHWDGSSFLNLYYTKKLDQNTYATPQLFNKELDSRYHDGPASFYDGGNRMILNRNKQIQLKGRENTWMWHLALYEGQLGADNKWLITLVPFDVPSYSFAHPAISDDGNTLYFVSDMPGGYGGTDIYRVTRTVNGQWSKPFNLGPVINTTENEVFPFSSGDELFFASNGHGGLGGLDILRSTLRVNGFTPPINPGYPVNSRQDDFSFIQSKDGSTGFFASARTGNDDIYEFSYHPSVWIAAHVYDAQTNESLGGATVDLITSPGTDTTFIADSEGRIRFKLPQEQPFVLIANKAGRTGMLSTLVKAEENETRYTHPVPAFGDPEKVAMVGHIKDEQGVAAHAKRIVIRDESTGTVVDTQADQPVVSFLGEKGRNYSVIIYNERGDSTVQELSVASDETGTRSFEMVIKPNTVPVTLAVRVFNVNDNTPLSGARVQVMTFSDSDLELTANAEGIAEFTLMEGTAYMVIGSKGELSGLHSGIADPTSDKTQVIHPVAARATDDNRIPVMVLTSDAEGNVIDPFSVTVFDETTHQPVTVQLKEGVISFESEKGHTYSIHVQEDGFESVKQVVTIPAESTEAEKVGITLQRRQLPMIAIKARVFKTTDQQPLANATVDVVSIVESDIRLTTDAAGEVSFELPHGTAFVILADGQGFSGMNSGEAESELFVPVPVSPAQEDQAPVLVRVEDKAGQSIMDASVVIRNSKTGETLTAKSVGDGLFMFMGYKGEDYTVESVTDLHSIKEEVSIPVQATDPTRITLTTPYINEDGGGLIAFNVQLYMESTGEPAALIPAILSSVEDGNRNFESDLEGRFSFALPGETSFVILAAKGEYSGRYAGFADASTSLETIRIALQKTEGNKTPVAMRVLDSNNQPIANSTVEVVDNTTGSAVESEYLGGIALFTAESGKTYDVRVKQGDHVLSSTAVQPHGNVFAESVVIPAALAAGVKSSNSKSASVVSVSVKDENNQPVPDGMVQVIEKETGRTIPATFSQGVVRFTGEQGKTYDVVVTNGNRQASGTVVPVSGEHKDNLVLSTGSPNVALRIQAVDATDQSPVAGAEITITRVSGNDLHLTTGANGMVTFELPEQTAFIGVGMKGALSGMFSGLVESPTEGTPQTFTVMLSREETQRSVVGLVKDKNGRIVRRAMVTITNKVTGEVQTLHVEGGTLAFMTDQNTTYEIHVASDGYDDWTYTLQTGDSGSGYTPLPIAMQPKALSVPASTSVVVVKNGEETAKVYLLNEGQPSEIIERNGTLYLTSSGAEKELGRGSLDQLGSSVKSLSEQLGMAENSITSIQNIYFDFDSYQLTEVSKLELRKVAGVMSAYPTLNLVINGHADDRGTEAYNYNLSRRRTRSIENFLGGHGVTRTRVAQRAYGESTPAVKCVTAACTEEQHRLNRRAEFSLVSSLPADLTTPGHAAEASPASSLSYADILAQYGDRHHDEVIFKVTIGAYRYNHNLTFSELNDIGTVETNLVDGVMYYYLGTYTSLNEVEQKRQEARLRSVPDASIRILYQGKSITVRQLVKILDGQ